ncbi:hypothetical protein AhyD4_23180 (plasmid) [Aeromonas hydrophila]|uniref:hypothetical protein n=1 Tax=Aeromonas hydrophila TaxID=644 RepID=UPI000744971A|nr:hypothetical protein [Aeromonas hydrophila]ALZ82521.1 hypothetical protein AhyD4_23180 [Aeromonas hydrophila]
MTNYVQCSDLPVEVQQMMKYKAATVEDAIAMHRQGHVTIVDNGVSWSVYRLGEHLGVVTWEGHKGTPRNVPCVPRKKYLDNVSQYRLLSVEPVSESQLRDEGIDLTMAKMLELLVVDGPRLVLPTVVTFSPLSYQALRKALTKANGKYQDASFVFDSQETATDVLTKLMQGHDINIKKTLQYYPTTDLAGERLLDGLKLSGKVVFEPSAGEGSIVRRALAAGAKEVLAVELYEPFHESLRRAGGRVIGRDIFDVTPDDVANVDVVLMNPPFSGAQDVKHVEYVLSIVPDHVEIHSIMSGAVPINSSRIYQGFRSLLDAFGIKPEDLPAGTFKDSGTQVKSCIVRIPSRRKTSLVA